MRTRTGLDDWTARADSLLVGQSDSRDPYWRAESDYYRALKDAQTAAERALDAALVVRDSGPCDTAQWARRALQVSGANNTLAALGMERP